MERIFDAHFHVFEPYLPLLPKQGFVPSPFSVEDYLSSVTGLGIQGGAVVAASVQGLDPQPVVGAVDRLGPGFVGIVQLEPSVTDAELRDLAAQRIRGIRFNLVRGDRRQLEYLVPFARRVYDLVGWHAEVYVGDDLLPQLEEVLTQLPAVSIDHLGLSSVSQSHLLRLAHAGVRVKASGFGRTDSDVAAALSRLFTASPTSLMFGTDLPSTRARRPFRHSDIQLITSALGPAGAHKVLWENAIVFYGVDELP